MRILILTLLLAACGNPEPKNPLGATESHTEAPNEPAPTSDTPDQQKSIVDDSTVETVRTIALDTPKDMPACGADNSKQLVYVKSEAKFYSCESVGWSSLEITVKGDKGEPGQQGPKGDQGEPGLPGNSNSWVDVMTGYTWMLGAGVHFVNAQNTCSNQGWRMPTVNEAIAAIQNGINLNYIWASDTNPTAGEAYVVSAATNLAVSKPVGDTYEFGCIKTVAE